jgi:hypothetical protein
LSVPKKVLAPALVAVTALFIVPAAEAATVATPATCVRVVPGQLTFPVQASGFTASSALTFTADGSPFGNGTADAAGNFDNTADPSTWFDANGILPADKNTGTVQLAASDAAGVAAAPVPVSIARITVTGPPDVVKPNKRVRFRVFGFQPNKRVYLHIRRKGKTLGRTSLGRTDSPCGNVSKRIPFMPLKRYQNVNGTYRYFFSHSKKFSKKNVIFGARVRISSSLKSTSAQTGTAAWR